MTIHLLKEGRAVCGAGAPTQWPQDDHWVSFNDPRHFNEVDCWRCICTQVGRAIPTEPKSPMHDLVKASNDLPQQLCEFVLEFLQERGIHLSTMHKHDPVECFEYDGETYKTPQCSMQEGSLWPANLGDSGVAALAAEFIGVDKKAYDAEKDALLAYIREMHTLEQWAQTEGRMLLSEPAPLARCNKLVRSTQFICDEEPGHGGRCFSKLYRTRP